MLLVWPTSKYGNAVNAAKPNWKITPSLPWLICSGIYNIALNLKETAKVPRTPGKSTAQDLGRSSSDEQITCNWTGRWVSIPLPQNQLGQPAWRQELGGCRIQGLAGPGSAPLGGWGIPFGQEAPGPPKRELWDVSSCNSLCDSSGRKVSTRASPEQLMKSKATKTEITYRSRTGILFFLLYASLQWRWERMETSPAWPWGCHRAWERVCFSK